MCLSQLSYYQHWKMYTVPKIVNKSLFTDKINSNSKNPANLMLAFNLHKLQQNRWHCRDSFFCTCENSRINTGRKKNFSTINDGFLRMSQNIRPQFWGPLNWFMSIHATEKLMALFSSYLKDYFCLRTSAFGKVYVQFCLNFYSKNVHSGRLKL